MKYLLQPIIETLKLCVNEASWSVPSFYDFSSYTKLETWIFQQLQAYASYSPKSYKIKTSVEEIKEYIDKNYTSNLTLTEVADQFFISYSHLSKLFRERFGVTFQEYLIHNRMDYAEQLLQYPNLTLQEIATMTCYDNVFNFSRAFKKHFGISPSHYRKQ